MELEHLVVLGFYGMINMQGDLTGLMKPFVGVGDNNSIIVPLLLPWPLYYECA